MAIKRVWAGSALLLLLYSFRADGNDSLSLDAQTSQPSVTTDLTSAETDGVKATDLRITASPLDVQHTNEITAGVTVTVPVSSMNPDSNENEINATAETTRATLATTVPVTTTPKHSNTPDTKWDDKWDAPFIYDYSSLRQGGLIIATVLFLLGIMVITCGKMKCRHRCRTGRGRSYDVTRM
ncbi:FXYD domain containing ion transport regulator 5 isoform X2 [Neoarius graeffei]|uniref:FXYD domain containing ion transport regulator 5 isoform X2 n=1 Tax=Neoarius graeffei TaxID=443677 RepID=UPI00298BDB1B|nr:FXYD domain containing ion transport regulator 5 isoform X2 [Neoarius graeffei]